MALNAGFITNDKQWISTTLLIDKLHLDCQNAIQVVKGRTQSGSWSTTVYHIQYMDRKLDH